MTMRRQVGMTKRLTPKAVGKKAPPAKRALPKRGQRAARAMRK
jgi:hypothetical protein